VFFLVDLNAYFNAKTNQQCIKNIYIKTPLPEQVPISKYVAQKNLKEKTTT